MNGPTETRARPSKAWLQLTAVAIIVVMLGSACGLAEGPQYTSKSEGLGVRINFRATTTNQLQLLSTVASVTNPDAALKQNGITNVSCSNMWGTQARGDQCAFRVVRGIKVSGGLADAYRHVWEAAINGPELSDFVNDSMKLTRQNSGRCISVYVGWSMDADWSYKSYSSSSDPCGVGTGGGGSWVKQKPAPSRSAVHHYRSSFMGKTKTKNLSVHGKSHQARARVSTSGGGGGGSW